MTTLTKKPIIALKPLSESISQVSFMLFLTSLPAIIVSNSAYAQDTKEVADNFPTATLNPITITARESDNIGYTIKETTSSTGLPLTVKELPQSISTITSQQIQEKNIDTMDYALAQATGVSHRIYGSNGAGYNDFYARGNRISNFQLDGVSSSRAMENMGNISAAPYERIEVVRGVSGLLDGTGDTSATVNLVRKRPTATPKAEVSVSAGSRNNFATRADVSGSLTDDDSLRGRLVVSATDGDSWRKREHTRTGSVYGIIDYDINDDTTVTGGMSYDKTAEDESSSISTLTYDSEGYATKLGSDHNPSARWAYADTTTLNTFLGVNHDFNDIWQGKLEYNFTKHTFDHPYAVAGVIGIDHNTGATDVIPGYWEGQPKTHSINASLNGEYQLFGRNHELVAGVNGFHYKNNRHGERTMGTIGNIYDDSLIANYPKPDSYMMKIRDDSENRQYGGYLATNLHPVDNLSVLVGGRYSDFDYKRFDRTQGKIVVADGSKVTPYTGVVYDVTDNLSTYASYTELFIPQQNKDINGNLVAPITGNNMEVGVKGSWYDDSLNASISVYQAKKDDLAVSAGKHADNEAYYKTTDHSKTTGWEIDVAGAVTQDWHVQAGYTQALNRDDKGNRLNTDSAPRHNFKLFSTYDLSNGNSQGLKIGGGVRWQSETYVANPYGKFTDEVKARVLDNTKQSSYAVVDLMADYRMNEHNSFMLNVDNVLNEKYQTQPGMHNYGKERAITGTWRYEF